jgi:hypothetical protein
MFEGFLLKGIKHLVSDKRPADTSSCTFPRLVSELGGSLDVVFGTVGAGGCIRPAGLVDSFSRAAIGSRLISDDVMSRMFLLEGCGWQVIIVRS